MNQHHHQHPLPAARHSNRQPPSNYYLPNHHSNHYNHHPSNHNYHRHHHYHHHNNNNHHHTLQKHIDQPRNLCHRNSGVGLQGNSIARTILFHGMLEFVSLIACSICILFLFFFFLCFSLFTCRPINYRRISSLFSLFYDTYPSICFISIVLSISALCSVGIVSTHLCLHVCRFTSRFEPEEFDFHTRTHTRARAYISIVLTFFFCSTLFDWRCLGFVEFCLTSSNFQFSPLFTFVHFLLVSRNGRQSLNWELAR